MKLDITEHRTVTVAQVSTERAENGDYKIIVTNGNGVPQIIDRIVPYEDGTVAIKRVPHCHEG